MDIPTPPASDSGTYSGRCSGPSTPERYVDESSAKRKRLASPDSSCDELCTRFGTSARTGTFGESMGELQRDGFIRLSSEAHDMARTECHLPDLSAFVERLETAFESQNDTHRVPYQSVATLLIQFEDDDLGVASEVKDLADMFQETYNFDVDVFKIPSTKEADEELHDKVRSFFRANDALGNLCIVYYGGHAIKEGHAQPIWVSNRQKEIEVDTSMIFPLFRKRDADIWLLFDSCQAMPNAFNSTGKGVVAALTATGFESGEYGVAAEVGSHSFTHTLVQVLGHFSVPIRPEERSPSFTDVSLHSRMLTELSKWPVSLQKGKDGSYLRTMHGHHVVEPCRRRTPIYQFLSKNKEPKPIRILPLPKTQSSPLPCRQPRSGGEDDSSSPHVLISIRLSADELPETDVQAWAKWMLSVPNGLNARNQVTIEAIYPSLSTLVILRLPLSLWDLLPKDDGMTFMAFVTGDNYIQSMRHRVAATMDSIVARKSSELTDEDIETGLPNFHSEIFGDLFDTTKTAGGIAEELFPPEFTERPNRIATRESFPPVLAVQGDPISTGNSGPEFKPWSYTTPTEEERILFFVLPVRMPLSGLPSTEKLIPWLLSAQPFPTSTAGPFLAELRARRVSTSAIEPLSPEPKPQLCPAVYEEPFRSQSKKRPCPISTEERAPSELKQPCLTSDRESMTLSDLQKASSYASTNHKWGYADDVPPLEDVLGSLAFPDMDSGYRKTPAATDGTCDWLVKTDAFKSWVAGDQGALLCIKEKGGTGKSMLARHVLDSAMRAANNGKDAPVIKFFFHSEGDELQRTPSGLFRSLLHQLLSQAPDAIPDLGSGVESEQRSPTGGRWSKRRWVLQELQDHLLSSLSKVVRSRPVWIVVDALDECGEESAKCVIDYFTLLLETLPPANLHICISCRQNPRLESDDQYKLSHAEWDSYGISAYVRRHTIRNCGHCHCCYLLWAARAILGHIRRQSGSRSISRSRSSGRSRGRGRSRKRSRQPAEDASQQPSPEADSGRASLTRGRGDDNSPLYDLELVRQDSTWNSSTNDDGGDDNDGGNGDGNRDESADIRSHEQGTMEHENRTKEERTIL